MHWQIGEVRITRVQELEAGGIQFILPDATPGNLQEIGWLAPDFVDDRGEALASVHALVIETPEQRIVVDTCVGNDKQRSVPTWNELQTRFLDDFREAGFEPESIDAVVCTHLHIDHVGWNTRLVDGRWQPTFPNARYLIGRAEWAHWNTDPDPESQVILGDSVRPVIEAGLVDWVESDHRLGPEVWLEPTPGHTPGHVSVRIASQGAEAVITGDLIHHPCQMARPHWSAIVDVDREQALRTRNAFLERHADSRTLVIGTHFPGPTAGHVVREDEGEGYRLKTR
ncbi:MAG: MBL fold metallo-hydrolase [bacterium]